MSNNVYDYNTDYSAYTHLLRQLLRQPQYRSNRTNRNTYYGNNSEFRNRNSSYNDILSMIEDYNRNIRNYQDNYNRTIEILGNTAHENNNIMRDYQSTMSFVIRSIINLNPGQFSREHTNTRQSNSGNTESEYEPIFTYTFPLADLYSNEARQLTSEQINMATQTILYNSSVRETTCPVSWEDFTEGEAITQIKHCRHCFKTVSIMNCLRSDPRCPVCRYDLRTWREPTSDISGNTPDAPVATNTAPAQVPSSSSRTTNQSASRTRSGAVPVRSSRPTRDTTNTTNTIQSDLTSLLNNVFRNMTNDLLRGTDLSGNDILTYSVEFMNDIEPVD